MRGCPVPGKNRINGLSWVTRVPKNKIAGPSQLEGAIFHAHRMNFTPSSVGNCSSPSNSDNKVLKYVHCFKAAAVCSACFCIIVVITPCPVESGKFVGSKYGKYGMIRPYTSRSPKGRGPTIRSTKSVYRNT